QVLAVATPWKFESSPGHHYSMTFLFRHEVHARRSLSAPTSNRQQVDERSSQCAQVAELVDALGSGPSGGNTVEVRVFSWAPLFRKNRAPGSVFSFLHAPFFINTFHTPTRMASGKQKAAR